MEYRAFNTPIYGRRAQGTKPTPSPDRSAPREDQERVDIPSEGGSDFLETFWDQEAEWAFTKPWLHQEGETEQTADAAKETDL